MLGLDAVDDGVHKWRKEKVDIAHGYMHHMWGMLSKPVDEGQTNHSDVKDQDTTNVRNTGVESLCSLLSRGDAHNCLQNEDI